MEVYSHVRAPLMFKETKNTPVYNAMLFDDMFIIIAIVDMCYKVYSRRWEFSIYGH